MEKLVVRNFIYPAFLTAPLPLSFADQFAFRPSGSTTAAIIALLQKITTLLITNPYVVVIVLDFSKAFDTVRHATLMEKYSMLDLDDCVFNWLNSFFTDHEHCTIFNGITSPFLGINSSVIQGSGIGPASYSVNASDLRPCTDGNDIVKFADDFDLVIPASNIDSRSAELRHVEVWSVANNLRLNRNKSQEIIFYRPHTRKNKIPQSSRDTRNSKSQKHHYIGSGLGWQLFHGRTHYVSDFQFRQGSVCSPNSEATWNE